MELILLLVVLGVLGAVAVVAGRRSKERELQRREDELAPVKKLAFEDITAFGVDLQELDYELSGHELDAGANADYQRALDTYESAKTAGDSITQHYDPLLAKVLAHGPTRQDAIERLLDALRRTRIKLTGKTGPKRSNLDLMLRVIDGAKFRSGDYTTHLLEELG